MDINYLYNLNLYKNEVIGKGYTLKKIKDGKIQIEIDELGFTSVLFQAVLFALPNTLFSDGISTRVLFSYYDVLEQYENSLYLVTENDIDKINIWFDILKLYNLKIIEDNKYKRNWWYVASNELLLACNQGIIEMAYVNLITALEAISVNTNTELSYRVSLNTSLLYSNDKEVRENTFKLIKDAYDIRSKLVHGAPEDALKKVKQYNYKLYFELKSIISTLLLKYYDFSKESLIKGINSSIMSCPEINSQK